MREENISLKITYSAGPDAEGENVSGAGHGDGDSRLLHRQSQPLRQGPLRDGGVLVEVIPASHDDEHVIYPNPFVRVKGSSQCGSIRKY